MNFFFEPYRTTVDQKEFERMASFRSTHNKNARRKNSQKKWKKKREKTPKKRTFIKCKVVVKTRPSFTPVFIFSYIFLVHVRIVSYSLPSTHTWIIFNSTLYIRRKCFHLICSYILDIGALIVLYTFTICAVRGKLKNNPLELSFLSCYSIFSPSTIRSSIQYSYV